MRQRQRLLSRCQNGFLEKPTSRPRGRRLAAITGNLGLRLQTARLTAADLSGGLQTPLAGTPKARPTSYWGRGSPPPTCAVPPRLSGPAFPVASCFTASFLALACRARPWRMTASTLRSGVNSSTLRGPVAKALTSLFEVDIEPGWRPGTAQGKGGPDDVKPSGMHARPKTT